MSRKFNSVSPLTVVGRGFVMGGISYRHMDQVESWVHDMRESKAGDLIRGLVSNYELDRPESL